MKKKVKEEVVEAVVEKAKIASVPTDLGREDLNALARIVNELVERANS